jgi:hypothetical protein
MRSVVWVETSKRRARTVMLLSGLGFQQVVSVNLVSRCGTLTRLTGSFMNHVHLEREVFFVDAVLRGRMEMELSEVGSFAFEFCAAAGNHLYSRTQVFKLEGFGGCNFNLGNLFCCLDRIVFVLQC